jgi:ribosomal protein L40E
MANTKFCPMCGAKAQITSNFCGSCGASLNSLTPKKSEPSKANQTTFEPFSPDREDEDDSYIDRLTHLPIKINALELEESRFKPRQKETIGTVVSQGAGSDPSESRGAGRYSTMSREEFLKEFSKEASAPARPE